MVSLKSLALILLFGVVGLNNGAANQAKFSVTALINHADNQITCHRCNQQPIDQPRLKRLASATSKPAANSNRQDPLNDPVGLAMSMREPIMDRQMADNVTNSLNDMAQNLRRMFMENRKLQNQLQDVFGRLQNVTGVNASTITQNMPKNTNGIVNNIMTRLQQQQQQLQQQQ